MTQINKIRRKSGGHISYKFYGKELSAGFDVKFIIDNHNILKDAFTPVPKIVTMKHLDELRLFFLAKKISDMEEIIPYINSNENKAIAQDLIVICHKYYNGIGKGVIIKYINKSYRRIFNKNKFDHALVDVVLDFIFENNKGIEKSVWMFLADEYGYRLLNEYAKIKKVLLRNDYGSAMLDKMVKIKNPTSLIEYHLNDVFSVLSDILLNHKENDKLTRVAEQKTNQIYDIVDNLNEDDITERDLLIKDSIYRNLLDFLRRIKDKRANKISQKVNEQKNKLESWLKSNGKTIQYEIPVGEIVNEWRKIENWELRLLNLTHDIHKENDGSIKVLSRLTECEKPKSFSDFCSTNMPTSEYFTCSRQLALQTYSNVGSGTIFAILLNDNDTEEYYRLLASAMYHIQNHSKSTRAESISMDIDLLASNIETIRKNKDKSDVKPFYYGASMIACALSEKLLKILYEDIMIDEQYLSSDSLELWSLLDSSNKKNPLIAIFGVNHLKHLAYFLCKDGNNQVGYGIRNSLAHLSDNIEEKLSDHLLSQLLWVLTDILNTAFWYYASNTRNV